MPKFEFSDDSSHKFWHITLSGKSFTVVFGRIGTSGQTQEKTFASEEQAKKEYDKLIAEKKKKGYVEVSGDAPAKAPRPVQRRKGEEALKEMLKNAGIDVTSFQKLSLASEEEEEESSAKSGEFFMIATPASSAVNIWEKARKLSDESGYYPIITREYEQLFEYMEFNEESPASIIKASQEINTEEWLEEKKADLDMDDDVEGEWEGPNGVPDGTYYTVSSADHADHLTIIMCPTKTSWQIPAVLRWGGSNDGIDPEYHTAMFKRWHDQYGAEVVCATMDCLELKVAKPPDSEAGAMKLAHEQYIYCPDIVDQGTQTIGKLAGEIVNSHRWFFWWD